MRVAILGGGISGLSAAFAILQDNPNANVVVFDAARRLGGCIDTTMIPSGEQMTLGASEATANRLGKNGTVLKSTAHSCRGDLPKPQQAKYHLLADRDHNVKRFYIERGPRTFQVSRSPKLLRLIKELGLPLRFSDPAASTRYLWHRGKLRPLQSFWPTMLGALARDLIASRSSNSDESLSTFARRRFGARASALLLDPLATGVFGGKLHELSAEAAFPTLWQWEQRYGSCILGWLRAPKRPGKGLFTIDGGLQTLIDALAKLPIDVRLNTHVDELRSDGVVAGGEFFAADQVIAALPAHETARLVAEPLHIPYAKLWVVNLCYDGELLPQKGYGYLVPSQEGEQLLGMIWDSAIFPTPGQTNVTAMVRGANPEAIALEAMASHLGVHASPAVTFIREAWIPQYTVGHAARVAAFCQTAQQKFPKLILRGNWLTGPSVETCIFK